MFRRKLQRPQDSLSQIVCVKVLHNAHRGHTILLEHLSSIAVTND